MVHSAETVFFGTVRAAIGATGEAVVSWVSSTAAFADTASSAVSALETFAEKGILGAVILVLIFVVKYLNDELKNERLALKAERDARLEDAKAYRDAIVNVNEKVHETVTELSRIVEFLETRRK